MERIKIRTVLRPRSWRVSHGCGSGSETTMRIRDLVDCTSRLMVGLGTGCLRSCTDVSINKTSRNKYETKQKHKNTHNISNLRTTQRVRHYGRPSVRGYNSESGPPKTRSGSSFKLPLDYHNLLLENNWPWRGTPRNDWVSLTRVSVNTDNRWHKYRWIKVKVNVRLISHLITFNSPLNKS